MLDKLCVFLVQHHDDIDGWGETVGVFDTQDAAETAASAYWALCYPTSSPWYPHRGSVGVRVMSLPLNTLDVEPIRVA